jgi:hypothetical protein
VGGEGDEGDQAADDGVPVQDAGVGTDAPVGPERQEEVVVRAERDAADYVGERGSEEDGEQRAGDEEEAVEEAAPDAMWSMCMRSSMLLRA